MAQTHTLMDSMLDNIRPHGRVTVEVITDEGTTVYEQNNVVTNNGVARIAAVWAQDSTTFPYHIGIGTDDTAAATTDTALGTEVDRNAIVTDFATGAVATFKAFFSKAEANGNTIAELGMFDAASGGTMFCRSVLATAIVKDATKSINVTWTITFADA